MSILTVEQRLSGLETDIKQIKSQLTELLTNAKGEVKPSSQEVILSAKEVAAILNLDINVIYAKCVKEEMPYFKMGKLYKFKKSEVLT